MEPSKKRPIDLQISLPPPAKERPPAAAPTGYLRLADAALEITQGAHEDRFNLVIMLCICIAGLSVGVHLYESLDKSLWLLVVDTIVLLVFVGEVVVKIVAEGHRPYMYFIGEERAWNCFDITIVILSLPWISVDGAMALRLLRLMRVQKFAKQMPQVRMIMSGFVKALQSSGYIMLLLGMVFYVFAIAGWYFFRDNDPWHFRNVPIAFVSLFRAATLEDWTDIMYINIYGCNRYESIYVTPDDPAYESTHRIFQCNKPKAQPALAATYWVLFTVVAGLVALSLFVGAVTVSMGEMMNDVKEERERAQKEARAASALKALEQAQATGGQAKSGAGEITPASLARLSFAELIEYRNNNELSGILFNALGGGATAAAGAGEEDDVEAGGGGANKRSLTTVHPSGPLGYYLRLSDWCYQLVEDERFTALVTFFIVLASVAVGLETDTAVMASRTAVLTLRYLDLLITWVFVAECVLKICAENLTPLAYFKSGWNCFDFLIVVSSFASGGPVKVLRLLRLFRLLKMIRNFPELAVMVNALVVGMSSMWFICVMLLLVFYLFGIVGVMLYRRNDPWHFGYLHTAMLSLFRIATGEDWTDIMYINMYGCRRYGYSDDDTVPRMEDCENNQRMEVGAALFFILFFMIGSLVMLNLFVGVITTAMDDAAGKQKERNDMEEKLETYLEEHAIDKATASRYRKAFDKIDLDGSEEISSDELLATVKAMGIDVTNEQAELWMALADVDGSGSIDVFEFTQFMHKMSDGDAAGTAAPAGQGGEEEAARRAAAAQVSGVKASLADLTRLDPPPVDSKDGADFSARLATLGATLNRLERLLSGKAPPGEAANFLEANLSPALYAQDLSAPQGRRDALAGPAAAADAGTGGGKGGNRRQQTARPRSPRSARRAAQQEEEARSPTGGAPTGHW